MTTVLFLLTLGTAVSFYFTILSLVTRRTARIHERMGRFAGRWSQTEVVKEPKTRPNLFQRPRTMFRQIGEARPFERWNQALTEQLKQADLRIQAQELIGFVSLGAGLAIVAGIVFDRMMAGVAVAALILYSPVVLIRRGKARRLKKIESHIGDLLTAISNSLRAGYSFLQAMDHLSKEMQGPLAAECERVVREINWGVSTEDALQSMSSRIGSKDLDLVITAIVIQRQVGGNLAEVLDNISMTIRERLRIQGEIRTLTAQGRFSALIFTLLPFVVGGLLFMLNPSYLAVMFHSTAGWLMLGVALSGQAIGIMFIRKIIAIDF